MAARVFVRRHSLSSEPSHLSRDDVLLDLACALRDGGCPDVPVVSRYRGFIHIAHATEYLDRVVRGSLGHFRAEELGHSRLLCVRPAGVVERACIIAEEAAMAKLFC